MKGLYRKATPAELAARAAVAIVERGFVERRRPAGLPPEPKVKTTKPPKGARRPKR